MRQGRGFRFEILSTIFTSSSVDNNFMVVPYVCDTSVSRTAVASARCCERLASAPSLSSP
eukprot:COSAG01_NODE_40986_length_457_cov_0.720670_2_plen_59_part_01